ncbi:GSCFA domain-containing protein [Azospirillum sp. TSH64]|uniref:GSCFA domain-containing protein n=1 Tax=Azospirillum sp. TSH64 TaxID=652740 RepID=UPI000D6454D4|nr:GSCFA domain-containing protein [Azospirillum sp. TSH64]
MNGDNLALLLSRLDGDQEVAAALTDYLLLKPDDAEARVLLAESLLRLGRYQEGLDALESVKPCPKACELRAEIFYFQRRLREMANQLMLAAVLRPGAVHSQVRAAKCLMSLGIPAKNREAFRLARWAVRLASHWTEAWRVLATVSMYVDEWAQARVAYERLLELDPNDREAQHDLGSLLARMGEPLETVVAAGLPVSSTVVVNHPKARSRRKSFARYPLQKDLEENFVNVIRKHVANEFFHSPPILGREAHFVTFGSCFAGNVAAELKRHGRSVWHLPIGEDINNTFTNRIFFEWASGTINLDEKSSENLKSLLGLSQAQTIEQLKKADCFIYTLGLGAAFFDAEFGGNAVIPNSTWVGSRILSESYTFRTTGVDENVQNIMEIIRLIRIINPDVKIVLTLSPIPLLVSFERASAVLADCVSKSILRVAVHEVMKKNLQNVYYWPSFEVVRWIYPHIGQVYGNDDGVSRHVSSEVISSIIDVFLEMISHNV